MFYALVIVIFVTIETSEVNNSWDLKIFVIYFLIFWNSVQRNIFIKTQIVFTPAPLL